MKQLLLFALLSICKCASDLIIIKDLPLKSYEVDQLIQIEWTAKHLASNSSMVTIDLINDRPEVMLEPFLIGQNILASREQFEWKIPRFMKSAGDYHFRVYPQSSGEAGEVGLMNVGKAFMLTNPISGGQGTLKLLEPTGSPDGTNLESTCLLGEQCTVLWDYPEWASTAMPKLIDIKLYADAELIALIAFNVPVDQKQYIWQVPTDASLKSANVYAVIMASGKNIPALESGASYYLASSGFPFRLESRAEREGRRLENGTASVSTPITVEQSSPSTGMVDVPRPTYKADAPTVKIVTANTSSKVEFNGAVMMLAGIGSLILLTL